MTLLKIAILELNINNVMLFTIISSIARYQLPVLMIPNEEIVQRPF